MTDKALAIKKPKAMNLQQMVDEETANRKILTDFIKNHMARGTDYGAIHISKACQDKWNCKNSSHFSKDCLFKPGAEKFASLMKLRVEYKKDTDTWEMLGSLAGTICYICYLLNNKGEIVGEGRGCSSVAEKGSANVAVKIAEKRAKMDAVLSTGGLSDFFTQDLEDMQEEKPALPQYAQKQTYVNPEPKFEYSTLSYHQQKMIFALLTEKGYKKDNLDGYIKTKFDKESITKLTVDEANTVIEKIKSLPVAMKTEETEINIDEVAEQLEMTKPEVKL